MINYMYMYCWFYEIFIFLHKFEFSLKKKAVSCDYVSPGRKFYEEFKYAELLIGSKGKEMWTLEKFIFVVLKIQIFLVIQF